jgi:hypothetical protein
VTDLVRFLHVLAMATWLAASLWLGADARRALAGGAGEARAFLDRARAAIKLDRMAAVLTILTGLGLLHLSKAWPDLRPGLWVGMGLALVRAGLNDGLVGPALRKIGLGLAAGQDAAALRPHADRLALGSRLGHLAWLGALAGMLLFRTAP